MALQPAEVVAALEAAGFDAAFSDVVVGRREDGRRTWEVVVDRGGQLKVTISALRHRPTTTTQSLFGRPLRLLVERATVITATFALEDAAEVPKVLAAIEGMVEAAAPD